MFSATVLSVLSLLSTFVTKIALLEPEKTRGEGPIIRVLLG